MKFRAAGLEFNATVAESSESTSPATGNPLRSLTIQFRAQKEAMHAQALQEAQERRSGGLFSLDSADQPDQEWRIRESRSSYVGSEPWGINHHLWLIEQVERLACERLLLGSVSLAPYEYFERLSEDGTLRLAARAPIAPVDLDTVSRISEPVEIVRIGVSSTPRRMSLSYVWGERPEGPAIALVATDHREPRVSLVTTEALNANDPIADLLAILKSSAVLTQTQIDDLRRLQHLRRQVANIDGWSLTD